MGKNQKVFALGAGLKSGADFSKKEGELIYLSLAGIRKKVPALVTVTGSVAKKDG